MCVCVCVYSFYIYLIVLILMCDHCFFMPSAGRLPRKDSIKSVVADKTPYYQTYIKTNIYLFIIIFYNGSSTDIEYSILY